MARRILLAGVGRHARLSAVAAVLQLAVPLAADAGDSAQPDTPGIVFPSWDTLYDTLALGWSGVTGAVGAVPMAGLSLPAAILATRWPCLGGDAKTSDDCSAAVIAICARHGFRSGRQIDVESGQVCRITPQGFVQSSHAIACKPKVWLTQVACW